MSWCRGSRKVTKQRRRQARLKRPLSRQDNSIVRSLAYISRNRLATVLALVGGSCGRSCHTPPCLCEAIRPLLAEHRPCRGNRELRDSSSGVLPLRNVHSSGTGSGLCCSCSLAAQRPWELLACRQETILEPLAKAKPVHERNASLRGIQRTCIVQQGT